jgi:hypothetical protein
VLPWAAALAGCVFPDLDIIANVMLSGNLWHLFYLPHSVLPYLPLLALGWLLVRGRRTRMAGLTLLAFGAGVLSHLFLDAISHGVLLLYPLTNRVFGWTYPPQAGLSVQMAYLCSPNVLLEVGTLAGGVAWWWRYAARAKRAGRGCFRLRGSIHTLAGTLRRAE